MNCTRGRLPGQWWPTIAGTTTSANLYCPGCGRGMGLWRHTIDARGNVTPSVICPPRQKGERPACGFHQVVTLVGWPDHCR